MRQLQPGQFRLAAIFAFTALVAVLAWLERIRYGVGRDLTVLLLMGAMYLIAYRRVRSRQASTNISIGRQVAAGILWALPLLLYPVAVLALARLPTLAPRPRELETVFGTFAAKLAETLLALTLIISLVLVPILAGKAHRSETVGIIAFLVILLLCCVLPMLLLPNIRS